MNNLLIKTLKNKGSSLALMHEEPLTSMKTFRSTRFFVVEKRSHKEN